MDKLQRDIHEECFLLGGILQALTYFRDRSSKNCTLDTAIAGIKEKKKKRAANATRQRPLLPSSNKQQNNQRTDGSRMPHK